MKYFLVKKNDKFYKIGCSGFTPQGYEESLEIPKELEQEHQDDLEIVEEQIFEQMSVQMKDENGELVFTDETYVDDSGEIVHYKKPVYIKDVFEQVLVETRKSVVLNETKKAARLQAELEAQDAQKWVIMRKQRDQLLSACDFTQLADAPLSVELKASYLVYRQELRDLPENIVDINNFEWPIKPS